MVNKSLKIRDIVFRDTSKVKFNKLDLMKISGNNLSKGKILDIALYVFMFGLISLSIMYYKERICYYDIAFQFFKIIFFNDFNIEAHRYSTALVQIPTIIALNLGVSLKGLSIIFSASYVVLYSLIFIVIAKVLKINFAAIALVMSFAMGTSLGFFHTVTEIHQGIAYSFLFLGLIYVSTKRNLPVLKNDLLNVFALLVGMLAFFSHPTSFFLLIFILGYYLVDQRAWMQPKIYFFLIVFIISVILKVLLTDDGSYEGQLLPKPGLFVELMPKFWTLYSFKFFFNRIPGIYFFTVTTGIIVLINYLYSKDWLKLIYFILSSTFFFLITLVIYHEGNADIAMERIFLPLNVFIAIPFCKDVVLRNHRVTLKSVSYIVIVLILSITFIFRGALKYERRTDYLSKIVSDLSKTSESKFIACQEQLDMEIVEIPWAFSTETLLLSSLGKNPSKTVYLVGKETDIDNIDINKDNSLLVTDFWLYWDADKLNNKYFKLNSGNYQRMETNLR